MGAGGRSFRFHFTLYRWTNPVLWGTTAHFLRSAPVLRRSPGQRVQGLLQMPCVTHGEAPAPGLADGLDALLRPAPAAPRALAQEPAHLLQFPQRLCLHRFDLVVVLQDPLQRALIRRSRSRVCPLAVGCDVNAGDFFIVFTFCCFFAWLAAQMRFRCPGFHSFGG